jgi:RNase adapter protein RapZ
MTLIQHRPIIFVTGLAGAGISTTLKILEDCGFEVFDNFPLGHVESLLNEKGYGENPIAFGVDSRTRAFNPDRLIQTAKENNGQILFLNATNVSLQKRFSETRRTHPLAKDRTVKDGIIYERQWLAALIKSADMTIDTTDLSIHDLKNIVTAQFQPNNDTKLLSVSVMSFGFKNGVPRELDMVLDVRFLKNPHWDKALKSKTGQDDAVQKYIQSDKNCDIFYNKISDLMSFLLPNYTAEGKRYFTIGLGCTGGKHRSVYLAERLAMDIKNMNYPVTIRHRDIL